MNIRMKQFIREVPKGENHIHVEGSIPASVAVKIAKKNRIELPFDTEEGMTQYIKDNVHDLNSFLVLDRMINAVCQDEQDYSDVLYALGEEAAKQNIIYQELIVDYMINGVRGIPIRTVMRGYEEGRRRAAKAFGVDIRFIIGIDRSLPEVEALEYLNNLEPYLSMFDGIDLDCEERGNPCSKHKRVYERAAELGLFLTAHAGEDSGPENIWEALDLLQCKRINHGVRATEDPKLMKRLAEEEILLAVCVRSNVFLAHIYPNVASHPLPKLMKAGIKCSLNSDDPPYCGNLIDEYESVVVELGLDEDEMISLIRNSLLYSMKGQNHIDTFDTWVKYWKLRWENAANL